MLTKENFTQEHIRELQSISKRDSILIERTVYAFGLLEAIVRAGLPFIFKGGTCLMLLLEHPQRLSTDIDIMVEPGTDVEKYIERAAKIFPFVRYEEQRRTGKNKIEKRHFKFTYHSPVNGKELYILLDILYEENHYGRIVEREIRNELLMTEPEYLKVKVPSIECILGDKLTAFAPHTTGIPIGVGKDMEVMKQLYDVGTLADEMVDFAEVRNTYQKVAQSEIAYRGINKNVKDCLRDTFEAALCIASRGKYHTEEYPVYVAGIRDLRGHIYAENYSPEIAVERAVKAAYIAVCLMADEPFERVVDYTEYLNEKFTQSELMTVKYLRKVNPKAYAYMIKADRILNRLYPPHNSQGNDARWHRACYNEHITKEDNSMERVVKFLKEAETYYLATVEGDQPRVRPFGTAHIFEGRLYIQTGKVKEVSKQIHANPKVEICAFKNGEWLRVAGELVEDDRREARQSMLDAYPSLQKMYSADDGNTEVFYFKNATATFSSFTHEPEVVTF